jgi:hypothetical protein
VTSNDGDAGIRTTTLARVASKKRTSRKPAKPSRPGKTAKPARQGLSGNPQRRAEQLQERTERTERAQRYSAASALPSAQPKPVPWWPESHANILGRVRETAWPSDLLDVETLAGEIVGDEFHARMNTPGVTGLYPSRWLEALADEAVRALSADVTADGGDWPRLWAFLCGLHAPAVESAAVILEDHGHVPDLGHPITEPAFQPTGEFLVARDAYGGRFLVVAEFTQVKAPVQNDSDNPPTPCHWYAWDVDWCSEDIVVAAGPYGSGSEALAEWRAAVGPAAASAELSPCPPDLAVRLLKPALALGTIFEMIHGDEPRDLMHEYFRLDYRASVLAEYVEDRLPEPAETENDEDEPEPPEAEDLAQLFLAWHAERDAASTEDQDLTATALDAILDEWVPFISAERDLVYACSPHRIETVGALIRGEYESSYANAALRLLPDWAEWVLSRRPIDPQAAKRSLEVARAQAATFVDENYVADPEKERNPFTRQE